MQKKNNSGSVWKLSAAITVLISCLLIPLSGCSSSKTGGVIKIGLISPLTGDLADKGLNQEIAAKLAVDEINKNGGIADGKWTIELVSEDDAGAPSNSVTVATKLITQDEVHVIVGSLPSTCTLAVMEVTESYEITQIAPSSTAAAICQKGNQYIFRNAASDNVIVDNLVSYAMEEFGATRFAILHDTADYGVSGFVGMELCLEKYDGIELVAHETYTTGDTDFSVQLTKIEATNPEVVIVWGDGTSAYLSAQQIKNLGLDCKIMAGTSFATDSVFDSIGQNAEGLIFGTPFISSNPDPKCQEFVKKFEEQAGYSPDMNSAQNYDAIYLIKAAVEACDSTDSTKIRDAIRGLKDFEGVAGVMNFDETGESNKSINIVRITGGTPGSYEYLT